ncbi:STAS domain-containing protein [Plantactinospora veratri]|uniref:Anti-sigma factor antagonist n=1 Tax=Plantactinospora veratri TaxID=1436122 RepID=A0ABU7SLR3_9ACTN
MSTAQRALDPWGSGAPLAIALDPGTARSLTVRVTGDLDIDTVDLLRRTLDQVLRHEFASVAVDLSQLRFCDSSGLRVLLIANAEAERLGCRMYVVNPRPFVRRVFELTGVASLLGLPAGRRPEPQHRVQVSPPS